MTSTNWWHRLTVSREPDFVVGDVKDPHLRRWWLIPRNNIANVYLHQFLQSDDDRALHDHMYVNVSYLLEGSYIEHTVLRGGVHQQRTYHAGDVRIRLPSTAHRIALIRATDGRLAPCWSLFLTGPRVRQWGFHCPQGWRHWKVFVDDRDSGKTGRGCE